jgi:steroid delta-isomerase-like uncharacterized protein
MGRSQDAPGAGPAAGWPRQQTHHPQEVRTVPDANPTSVVRRALEHVFQATDPAAVDALYAPGFVNHLPPSLGREVRGREAVKRFAASWHRAFPDLRTTVEDLLADGDKVMARWVARGTHRGELWGLPPTGRPVAVPALGLFRVAHGRIAEEWLALDVLGLLQQLGKEPCRCPSQP